MADRDQDVITCIEQTWGIIEQALTEAGMAGPPTNDMFDSFPEQVSKAIVARLSNHEPSILPAYASELRAVDERDRLLALIDTMASGRWLVADYEAEGDVLARAARAECSQEPLIHEDPLGDIERYYPSCRCGWRSDPVWFRTHEEAVQVFERHNTLEELADG